MKTGRIALAVSAFLLIASASQASAIYIWEAPDNTYANTANNPCIFNGTGGSGCNGDPALWPPPATDTNGNFTTLTRTYDGLDYTAFTTYVSNSFILGLDINDTNAAQQLTTMTLDFFQGATNLASYSLSPAINVPSISNGVGYADYILSAGCSGTVTEDGAIDKCSLYTPFVVPFGTTKIVASFGYVQNADSQFPGVGNDGPDRVFAISTGSVCTGPDCDVVAAVPEPGSLLLLGTGLCGTIRAMKRRRRKA